MTGTATGHRSGRNQPNAYVSRSGQVVRATVKLLQGPWVDVWAAGAKNPIRLDGDTPEVTVRSAHVELTGPPKGAWSAELSKAEHWEVAGAAASVRPAGVAAGSRPAGVGPVSAGHLDGLVSEVGKLLPKGPSAGDGEPKQVFRLELTPRRGASALFRPVNGTGDWCTVTLTRGPWLSVWAVLNPSPMVLRPIPGGDVVKFWTTRFQMVGPDDQDWAADLDPGELWYPDIAFPV